MRVTDDDDDARARRGGRGRRYGGAKSRRARAARASREPRANRGALPLKTPVVASEDTNRRLFDDASPSDARDLSAWFAFADDAIADDAIDDAYWRDEAMRRDATEAWGRANALDWSETTEAARARGYGGDRDRSFTRGAARVNHDVVTYERKKRTRCEGFDAQMWRGVASEGKHMSAWERETARSERRRPARETGGIENLGNSCYIAASLQLLRSMRGFVESVHEVSGDEDGKPLLAALGEFFRSDASELSASGVKREMGRVRDEYGEFDQHDAMEFMTQMLDTIEREMGDDAAHCPSRQNFAWRIEHALSCVSCGERSVMDESMYMLTLQLIIDENESVDALLDRYFIPEKLERKCSCGCLFAISTRQIVSEPKFLLLHLKRFNAVIARGVLRLQKLTASIRLPSKMSLMHAGSAAAEIVVPKSSGDDSDLEHVNNASKSSPDTPGVKRHNTRSVAATRPFDLLAVISHHGNTVELGHFVAHIRERKSKAWKTYDDERVTSYVARDELIFNSLQEFERECYVVAYERDDNENLRQGNAQIF